VELRDGRSVAGGSFGEEHDRKVSRCCGLEAFACPQRRAASPALDVHRTRHGGHPSQERELLHLHLGHEDHTVKGREGHDVEVAHVVRDHRAAFRKTSLDSYCDSDGADRPGTELVQPFCSLLACGGPRNDEFQPAVKEDSDDMDASSYGPQESDQGQCSPLRGIVQNVSTVYPVTVPDSATPTHHNWIYRRGVLPILALLRMGATPRTLAWSIAVGLLIGINPVIGSTTVFCLAVTFPLRLNVVATQIANHAMFPLELALVIPFIRLGSRVFKTAAMPLSPHLFFQDARTEPLSLARQLWLWEWHALVVWAAIAVIAAPLIALALTPLLRGLLARIQRHQYPIVPTHP
jgi:uncharacterized protein (DUF2062 family)